MISKLPKLIINVIYFTERSKYEYNPKLYGKLCINM